MQSLKSRNGISTIINKTFYSHGNGHFSFACKLTCTFNRHVNKVMSLDKKRIQYIFFAFRSCDICYDGKNELKVNSLLYILLFCWYFISLSRRLL